VHLKASTVFYNDYYISSFTINTIQLATHYSCHRPPATHLAVCSAQKTKILSLLALLSYLLLDHSFIQVSLLARILLFHIIFDRLLEVTGVCLSVCCIVINLSFIGLNVLLSLSDGV